MSKETTDTDPKNETKPEPDLGDGGKKALEAERKARREAEHKAREASDRATALERAELRRSVASEKGLTEEQAGFLDGEDREQMAARADAMLAAFKPEQPEQPRGRPRENLKSGAVPGAEAPDVAKIAQDVLDGR